LFVDFYRPVFCWNTGLFILLYKYNFDLVYCINKSEIWYLKSAVLAFFGYWINFLIFSALFLIFLLKMLFK
jgi:hypothetical protein